MNRLRRTIEYLKSALWVVPIIAIPLELVLTRLLHDIDQRLGWTLLGLGPSGARAVLEATVTMTLSFIVFTFGSLLVAIQIASGQLTPRIIATTLLRDNVVRCAVGLFVFSMMFAISALNRLETDVHEFVLLLALILAIMSMATFLYLIDYAARLLRPISILTRTAETGLRVLKHLYPAPTEAPDIAVGPSPALGAPDSVVAHAGVSQVLVAVELQELIAAASAADAVVQLIPSVGDFVGRDEPLFAIYGGADAIDQGKLQNAILFGAERTVEQDPAFSFRIIADIALKALSPAINDPTTAVLAIDQLHRLLGQVGKRQLSDEMIRDEAGRLRVIFRTPNWEDFVYLACSEIRRCGAGNFQVARRLRAMIENLTAHAARAPSRCLAATIDAARSRNRDPISISRKISPWRAEPTRKGLAVPTSRRLAAPLSITACESAALPQIVDYLSLSRQMRKIMGDTITSAVTMINAGGRFPKKNSKAADAVAIATSSAITVTTIFPMIFIPRLMPAPSAGSSIVTDQAGTLVGLNWLRCSERIGAVSWRAGDRACTRPSTARSSRRIHSTRRPRSASRES